MRLEHSLTPYTKINSKWIKDLNVSLDTIKFLEENRQNTLWHKLQQDLFDPPPRVMKIKIKKWDLIKHNSFCRAKKTINKMKRQPSEWQKIFANKTTNKGLISKICKQFMKLNMKKTRNSIKKNKELNQKMGRRLN